jgi:organic hydroperoxide reductase OsmC/OhrA
MTAPFPHHYRTTLTWAGDGPARLGAGARPAIEGGAPAEFDGRDDWWSPEHLLLDSLALCLTTTFAAVARKARLAVHSYEGEAEAVLDRAPDGVAFTSFVLRVFLAVEAGEEERAESLLHKAKAHCLVAGALKVPVSLVATVAAAEPALAGR